MSFRDTLRSGKFIVTTDTIPPKGIDLSETYRRINPLKKRVDAINVVDMPSAMMRLNASSLGHLLKENGFEPIMQMTCRDRNRLSLQADLLGASILGIENLLIMGGDKVELSDDPSVKPVFELNSVELLRAARGLESGHDMTGKALSGSPSFCLGAVVDPGANPLDVEIEKMEKKVSAGAEFFQTQPIFDIDMFADFVRKVNYLNVSIIAGIFLLKSAKMAQFMKDKVPGMNIPNRIIEEMKSADDPLDKAIEIAVRTIKPLKELSKGVHIMTINWEDKIPKILDALGM